ncbi:hypothetical protein RJ640_008148 [Escallonia rubra]|uniref:FAR1 domain-containing protein n=1 Tax=Escallonia rubra TaxID=112253 RepID=A0AA88RFB5_9ASTE|nr:hypothetical protein RJ640_008148 [Escallonia rubra]
MNEILGFKKLYDKRQVGKQLKRHKDTRIGCGAMMQITLSKKLGMWVVNKFEYIHSHFSATPSKIVKHHSHGKYHHSAACKCLYDKAVKYRRRVEKDDFNMMNSKATYLRLEAKSCPAAEIIVVKYQI